MSFIPSTAPLTTSYPFLKKKAAIVAWLNQYCVEYYTLVPHEKYGFVVDTDSDVNLEEIGAQFIPVKFNIIKGDFNCSFNELTNLEFAPIECLGFDCIHNKLTSLVGCPQKVLGNFHCSENKIISLEDGPKEVGGNYWFDYNDVVSLKGMPKYIDGHFDGSHNCFKSLEYCPDVVEGEFAASSCQLETLEHLPIEIKSDYIVIYGNKLLEDKRYINSFKNLKQILETEKTAKRERIELNLEVPNINRAKSFTKNQKI